MTLTQCKLALHYRQIQLDAAYRYVPTPFLNFTLAELKAAHGEWITYLKRRAKQLEQLLSEKENLVRD